MFAQVVFRNRRRFLFVSINAFVEVAASEALKTPFCWPTKNLTFVILKSTSSVFLSVFDFEIIQDKCLLFVKLSCKVSYLRANIAD